jgi:outer membrane protein OmpA-like peptidoglycan-associated protein
MITAICFFLVGACAGAFMVFRHLKRLRLPGWVAIAHGLAGATGFAVLLLFCLREPAVVLARYALGILVGAIALGCVNVIYHLRGIRHRLALIMTHAIVAVTGVGTLTYAAVLHAQRPAIEPLPVLPEPVPSAAPAPIAKDTPPTQATAVAVAPPHETAAAHALGLAWSDVHVRFDSNRDRPTAGSDTALATIAQALADDPSIQLVEVQGHADERGAEQANVDLTRARSRAVVNALVARGVDPSRLRITGYGSRCPARGECRTPAAPSGCHSDDALREDRRVNFVVVEVGGRRFTASTACDVGGGS